MFLDEKHFDGCGGQVADDEARVTIAGGACRLLANRDDDPYPGLDIRGAGARRRRRLSRLDAGPGEAGAEVAADVARGRQRLLDAYGATRPAAFFAVATEVYFEKPRRLRREEPELYAAPRDVYRQVPAADGPRPQGGPVA